MGMNTTRKGAVARWLFAPDTRLPRPTRLVFYGLGLFALAASYALTGSEWVQLVVLLVLVFGALRGATRRFGVNDDSMESIRERDVPWRVMALAIPFLVAWGALVFLVVPDPGLGPWFWWAVVIWPWMELETSLAERTRRRDAGSRRSASRSP
jgi:hypothetical protein